MSSGSNNFVIGRDYVLTFVSEPGSAALIQDVVYIGKGHYLSVVDRIIESKDGKHLFEDIDIGGRSLVDWELRDDQIISYEEME